MENTYFPYHLSLSSCRLSSYNYIHMLLRLYILVYLYFDTFHFILKLFQISSNVVICLLFTFAPILHQTTSTAHQFSSFRCERADKKKGKENKKTSEQYRSLSLRCKWQKAKRKQTKQNKTKSVKLRFRKRNTNITRISQMPNNDVNQ